MFLPNERALEPQIAVHLSPLRPVDRQIEILSRATPKRDYYCQSRRGNRLFELGLSEVALAFTAASSKTDQAAIAEILDTHGRAGFAAAWLRRKGLGWAADILAGQGRAIGDLAMIAKRPLYAARQGALASLVLPLGVCALA